MANTNKATETAEVKETVKEIEPSVMDKLVTIRIPRENKDQEDVVVWVNDRRFLIKRGVAVDVPEAVALILEQQENMNQYIYEYESKKQR